MCDALCGGARDALCFPAHTPNKHIHTQQPHKIKQGVLRGCDQAPNLVLADCHERVYSSKAGVESLPIGLYFIRGDNVCVCLLFLMLLLMRVVSVCGHVAGAAAALPTRRAPRRPCS